ncbi:MAG: NADH-quinone oxidoreductase subunit J [Candidatus Lindowbacteria bacterium]|nr:NADH-quinone oxidoreductase subunit J [Candidatus Lindowbacteria bacterium]
MALVAYLVFGALAALTTFRAAKSKGATQTAILGTAAAAFLIAAIWAASGGISGFPDFLFYFLALVCAVSAVRVISQRNPVHSAVWLITVFLCVSVLFILRRADFLAAVQVIIYAGAIMVLYVFIIIFVDVEVTVEEPAPLWMTICAVGIATALLFVLAPVALSLRPNQPVSMAQTGYGSSEKIAEAIFFNAPVPFEAASLILLVALVGATLIGKAEKD